MGRIRDVSSDTKTGTGTHEVELAMKVADILRPRGAMSLSRDKRQQSHPGCPDPDVDDDSPVSHLNVVRDPLDKLVRVLGLHGVDVILDLLHRDLSSPVSGDGQVPSGSGVGRGHQVFGVEQLLTEFGDGETPVLLGSPGGQGSEPCHEKVETGERNHVDGELSQIRVQRSGELCGWLGCS